MSLSPGTRLGPYEILSPLGAGGMGEVYRARDTRLGRDVAVKVLPQHLSTQAEVRARFEREAKTVSALNHPHICVLFDIGREGDTDFLVMELVEGETLSARLAKGPLPPSELLRIGVQIADALSRAHRAGVIHRDLKPGNIMLTKSGAKLMDFGLARATGMQGTGSGSGATVADLTHSPTIAQPLTAEGTIIGTFQYMAPEQLEGKEADVRSDIWSLGCVLYEMATGKRAFEGRSQASLIAAILEHEPAPIAEVQPMAPPALDRLVRAMLAKDPDDRVQTAQDAKLQLEWMLGESSSGARAPSSVTDGASPTIASARRLSRARWLLLALPVLVAVAAFFAGRKSSTPPVATPFQFERKTFREQTIFTARFMPDSKTIVYSGALRGNRPQLFVIRPQYPEPKPIGPVGVHLLAISSQGELAVLSNASFTGHHRLFHGTLARMPLEGAAPREIMEDVREADWSPDGTELAVIHEVGGKDRLEYPIGKVLYESAGYLSDIRVSPHGDLIAFMEHPARWDDRGSVNVVDTQGHKRELSGGYWGMEGMAWGADGRTVLFSVSVNGTD
ncbi:MAG TPA: serine/threonine-protein kinase, partial [Candidatus Krumholzibacteria bacterium]|nr:serine/threonine-protein kinase [Candidatus Krumholzibacteria bacterium]